MRLISLAGMLPLIGLGAWILYARPDAATFRVVFGATIAGFLCVYFLWRWLDRNWFQPLDELTRRVNDSEPVTTDAPVLRRLARSIRNHPAHARPSPAEPRAEHTSPARRETSLGDDSGQTNPDALHLRLPAPLDWHRSLTRTNADTRAIAELSDRTQDFRYRLQLASAVSRSQFLIDELCEAVPEEDVTEAHDLRQLLDEAVVAARSLTGIDVETFYDETLHVTLQRDAPRLRSLIFNYLLSPGASAGDSARFHARLLPDHRLVFFVTTWADTTPSARLRLLCDATAAQLDRGIVQTPPLALERKDLAPAARVHVVAEHVDREKAISMRLQGTGCEVVRQTEADIQLVCLDDDEAVRQVLAQLPDNTRAIVAGGSAVFGGDRITQIHWPLYQQELEHALAPGPVGAHEVKRVLALDDDTANLALLADQVRGFGVKLVAVNDPGAALAAIDNEQFDAVLIDVNLSDRVSGFDVADDVLTRTEAPVVLLTAMATPTDRQRALETGVHAIVEKPLDVAFLMSIIEGKPAASPVAARRTFELPRLDTALALRLAGHRPEVAEEMLDALITSLPADVAAIEQAYDRADDERLRFLVHRLNGGLQYCGVPKLRDAVRGLESAVRQQDRQQVTLTLLVMKAEADALIDLYDANARYFETSVTQAREGD